MVTEKRLHCAQRPKMTIYSDNMITWKRTSNIFSNFREWSHFSIVRNYRKFSKYNNQQRCRLNDAIMLGEKNDNL